MRIFFFIAITLCSGSLSLGQSVRITGHIYDLQTNLPISGVNIQVSGSSTGTFSREDGSFELLASQDNSIILLLSHVSYKAKSITVNPAIEATLGLSLFLEPDLTVFREIIISSSPTGSGVQYQPVRSYSSEELERKRDITIGQMLDGEPGVSMRSFGPAPSRPVIRGLDGERILILENGERMGDVSESAVDHAVTLDPQALEYLEVIRGPASLLYGTSALGGVINMVTSDIPQYWSRGTSGSISLQGASVNNYAGGFGRLTYANANHAFTGRLSYKESGELKTPEGRISGTSMNYFDSGLGWGMNKGNTHAGIAISGISSIHGIPEQFENEDERVEIRFQRFALQGRFDKTYEGFFDRLQWRTHISRYGQDEVLLEELNGNLITEEIDLTYRQTSLSTSLNVQHKAYGPFDRGAFGVNLNARRLEMGGDDVFTPGDQYINVALFNFHEIPLVDQLKLQFGSRFDYRYIQVVPNDANPDLNKSQGDFNIAGSVGINFQNSNGLEAGFQLARAHRYPSVEERFANGVHIGAGTFEIGDEHLKTEVGFGGDVFMRWRLSSVDLEAAGFINHIQNFIVFSPTGELHSSGYPIFQYKAENVRLYGGEFTSNYRVNERLRLGLGADAVFGQLTDRNENLPFIPPFRLRIETEYTMNRFWVGLTIRQVFTQNRTAPEEEPTEGYTLTSFQSGFTLHKSGIHRLVFRVENLLNTSYRDHLSRIEDRQNPMPARNLSVGYSYIF